MTAIWYCEEASVARAVVLPFAFLLSPFRLPFLIEGRCFAPVAAPMLVTGHVASTLGESLHRILPILAIAKRLGAAVGLAGLRGLADARGGRLEPLDVHAQARERRLAHVALGVVLYLVVTRCKSDFALPGAMVAIVAAFYAALLASGEPRMMLGA